MEPGGLLRIECNRKQKCFVEMSCYNYSITPEHILHEKNHFLQNSSNMQLTIITGGHIPPMDFKPLYLEDIFLQCRSHLIFWRTKSQKSGQITDSLLHYKWSALYRRILSSGSGTVASIGGFCPPIQVLTHVGGFHSPA